MISRGTSLSGSYTPGRRRFSIRGAWNYISWSCTTCELRYEIYFLACSLCDLDYSCLTVLLCSAYILSIFRFLIYFHKKKSCECWHMCLFIDKFVVCLLLLRYLVTDKYLGTTLSSHNYVQFCLTEEKDIYSFRNSCIYIHIFFYWNWSRIVFTYWINAMLFPHTKDVCHLSSRGWKWSPWPKAVKETPARLFWNLMFNWSQNLSLCVRPFGNFYNDQAYNCPRG